MEIHFLEAIRYINWMERSFWLINSDILFKEIYGYKNGLIFFLIKKILNNFFKFLWDALKNGKLGLIYDKSLILKN